MNIFLILLHLNIKRYSLKYWKIYHSDTYEEAGTKQQCNAKQFLVTENKNSDIVLTSIPVPYFFCFLFTFFLCLFTLIIKRFIDVFVQCITNIHAQQRLFHRVFLIKYVNYYISQHTHLLFFKCIYLPKYILENTCIRIHLTNQIANNMIFLVT